MNFREDFPAINDKNAYFDNAATTQKPQVVIDAIEEYYTSFCANIHRGAYSKSIIASDRYEKAREEVADFIGAKPNEIIFTRNATESLNIASTLLTRKFEAGEIITSLAEHHSNFVPWLENKKNFSLTTIGLDDDYKHSIEEFKTKINHETQIVSLGLVSNILGIKNNLKEINYIAHEYGATTVVDAAQAAPHMQIDVNDLEIDVLALSAHKMLGPTGIGALYIREDILDTLKPYQVGGGTIKDVTLSSVEYAKPPSKYEAGTPNIAGAIGFSKAIKYINNVGYDRIEDHEKRLAKMILERFSELGIEVIGNTLKDKLGVIAFNIPDYNPNDVAMMLSMENIFVRSGHHCAIPLHRKLGLENSVRVSLYLYNTIEEVNKFLEVIERIVK